MCLPCADRVSPYLQRACVRAFPFVTPFARSIIPQHRTRHHSSRRRGANDENVVWGIGSVARKWIERNTLAQARKGAKNSSFSFDVFIQPARQCSTFNANTIRFCFHRFVYCAPNWLWLSSSSSSPSLCVIRRKRSDPTNDDDRHVTRISWSTLSVLGRRRRWSRCAQSARDKQQDNTFLPNRDCDKSDERLMSDEKVFLFSISVLRMRIVNGCSAVTGSHFSCSPLFSVLAGCCSARVVACLQIIMMQLRSIRRSIKMDMSCHPLASKSLFRCARSTTMSHRWIDWWITHICRVISNFARHVCATRFSLFILVRRKTAHKQEHLLRCIRSHRVRADTKLVITDLCKRYEKREKNAQFKRVKHKLHFTRRSQSDRVAVNSKMIAVQVHTRLQVHVADGTIWQTSAMHTAYPAAVKRKQQAIVRRIDNQDPHVSNETATTNGKKRRRNCLTGKLVICFGEMKIDINAKERERERGIEKDSNSFDENVTHSCFPARIQRNRARLQMTRWSTLHRYHIDCENIDWL